MCEDSTISRLLRYLEHLTSYTRSRCYTLVYVLGICLSLCCVSNSTNAQVAELYGLVNGTLLSIDTSNAEITEVTDLQTPSGWELIRLAFNTNDCLFYTIANPANSPHLISFDFDGNYTDIGLITLPGQQIYVIEGLDFNNFDKKMYASVSIDNTLGSGDTYCETLVEINTSDATAAIRASLATNATVEDDMDDISFIEDELFLNDIATSGSANFYALPLGGSGALLNPMLIGSQAFDLVTDIEGIDTKLFYCNILRELKVMDVVSGNVTNLGTTHGLFDYFGLPIVGLDFVTIETLELFPEDSVVCQSDGLELNIDVGQSSVLWNNGIQNATIQISTAGMYYATVTIDNCNYYTDTINVVFVDCDSCTSIGQSVLPSLSLGGTPFVCEGDSLFIDMGLSDSFMVAWNNGNTGAQTYFDAAGNYWAEVTYGACSWFTDTLMPQFVPCDTCINFEAQVLAAIDLGEDVDLCIGDSWDFTVNLDPSFDVQWNTGLNNNSISTNIAGTYSVEVIYGDCSWLSDSIEVGFLDCDSCATLEQEIANDLLLGPDQVLCEGSSLQLLLLLDDDYDITWSNGVNDILINVVDAGNYWAEVSYGACQWTTDTIAITFEDCDSCSEKRNEIADELILGSGYHFCTEAVELSLDLDGEYHVLWSTGDTSKQIYVNEVGYYFAQVQYGVCQWKTDTTFVTNFECPPESCKYFIPNAFSPNGDDINDYFKVYFDVLNCAVEVFNIKIYNRWGALVYQSNENTWDGYFAGAKMNPGVYAYVIEMQINSGLEIQTYIESGEVYLME